MFYRSSCDRELLYLLYITYVPGLTYVPGITYSNCRFIFLYNSYMVPFYVALVLEMMSYCVNVGGWPYINDKGSL